MHQLAKWHWHIEVSSKCALKCPRCAREEVPDTLINTELSLEFIQKTFTLDFISKYVEKVTFCGDDGDPIYAKDLIKIIRHFKSIKDVEIVIITNGSYKSELWWTELGRELSDIDEIHFSVDGWDQKTNEMYRVNSNFESILSGINTIRNSSNVFIIWDAILFSFNEMEISKLTKIATDSKCDMLQLTKSTKFHSIYPSYPILDSLQPSLSSNISSLGRFTREQLQLSNRSKTNKSKNTNIKLASHIIESCKGSTVTPLCSIGNKGLYISSLGKLYPCCWVANRYKHNNDWTACCIDLNVTPLNIAISNIEQINTINKYKWSECQTKCNSNVTTLKYCTEW